MHKRNGWMKTLTTIALFAIRAEWSLFSLEERVFMKIFKRSLISKLFRRSGNNTNLTTMSLQTRFYLLCSAQWNNGIQSKWFLCFIIRCSWCVKLFRRVGRHQSNKLHLISNSKLRNSSIRALCQQITILLMGFHAGRLSYTSRWNSSSKLVRPRFSTSLISVLLSKSLMKLWFDIWLWKKPLKTANNCFRSLQLRRKLIRIATIHTRRVLFLLFRL